ncbi:MAG: pilus assembly protein [Actinomycetospora chiangmaiensis]|jgi:Flp pilus assembly protein TadG|nr:pilus assembly protein [Actinomycetospora chiangmaiensis]
MTVRPSRRHACRTAWTCRGGSSAVEFALVAPMLLLLLAGITMFGICLGAAHNLRQMAAEAARASVAGVTDSERATLALNTVNRSLAAGAMFRPGSLTVQVGSDPIDATVYTVTLTAQTAPLGVNIFSRLLPMLPGMLRSTVSVRKGGL